MAPRRGAGHAHREHGQPSGQRARTHIRSALRARIASLGGKTEKSHVEARRQRGISEVHSHVEARRRRGTSVPYHIGQGVSVRALPHRAGRVVVVVEEVGCGDVRRVSGEVQACTPFRVWDQPEILLGAWLCRPRPHPPLPLFDRGTLLCTRAKRRHALAQLCPVVRCCFVAARSLFCRDVQMCPVPAGGRRNPPALRAGSRFKHASAYAWR